MSDNKSKILTVVAAVSVLGILVLTFCLSHKYRRNVPACDIIYNAEPIFLDEGDPAVELQVACENRRHITADDTYYRTADEMRPDKIYENMMNAPEAQSGFNGKDNRLIDQLLFSDQGFRLLCLMMSFIVLLVALSVWKSVKTPCTIKTDESIQSLTANVDCLMENAIRKEDLSKRCFWTKEALRRHFGYEGPEKCDEFIKWAYMRIWYGSDFENEQTKRIACDALKWGNIISLDEYARYVAAYKDCEVDFQSLDGAIDALELIRTKDLKEKPIRKKSFQEWSDDYYKEAVERKEKCKTDELDECLLESLKNYTEQEEQPIQDADFSENMPKYL